jgi:hypothetical protein
MVDASPALQCLLEEFKTSKAEQTARIGFRDNLIYVTVAGIGAVSAFALGKDGTPFAFLVSPWVAVVLGWTYLVNDEKISSIGRYVRITLAPKLESITSQPPETLLLLERAQRSDSRRIQRKVIQLSINLLTFIGSSFASIAAFLIRAGGLHWDLHWGTYTLIAIEALSVAVLAWQICAYADIEKGPPI